MNLKPLRGEPGCIRRRTSIRLAHGHDRRGITPLGQRLADDAAERAGGSWCGPWRQAERQQDRNAAASGLPPDPP
jgi:hypothetical protein